MAEIVSKQDDEIVIQVKVKLSGSMLEMENLIQAYVNQVGKWLGTLIRRYTQFF